VKPQGGAISFIADAMDRIAQECGHLTGPNCCRALALEPLAVAPPEDR
jgi:hypothetical protein